MTEERSASSSGSTIAREPGSYRDPSGFVFRRDGRLYRQVNRSFADDWAAFSLSGVASALAAQHLLVGHEPAELNLAAEPDDAIAVIAPDELPLITFPYEWSFSQLQDAALLTLQAQTLAEKHGMTLRDASAYNVQFADGRPILIDTLSFERLDPNAPWKPYRQFCEHFLAPLALMARRDPRLGLLLAQFVDGIPLDLASEMLPRRTRFSPGLAAHLHLHARSQRRHAGDGAATASVSMGPNRRAALLDHLRRTVSGLSVDPRDTTWAEYADQTSYTDAGTATKESAVRELLGVVGGATALDIGANTGRYSSIAVQEGYRVVALDGDWAAVERQYRALRERKETAIMPMLADIASPSPAVGWANTERASLLDRLHGDVAMALALVHHLAIGRNVPLEEVAALFAGMAPHLIVEWVPKEDPMVQRLLSAREDVFSGYTEQGFRGAFGLHFEVVREVPVPDSSRVIFLMRRR